MMKRLAMVFVVFIIAGFLSVVNGSEVGKLNSTAWKICGKWWRLYRIILQTSQLAEYI